MHESASGFSFAPSSSTCDWLEVMPPPLDSRHRMVADETKAIADRIRLLSHV